MIEKPTPPAPPMEEVVEESAVTIPKSIVGKKPVAVGDVVRLKVTFIDDEASVLGVEYATEEISEKGGVEKMAAEFD